MVVVRKLREEAKSDTVHSVFVCVCTCVHVHIHANTPGVFECVKYNLISFCFHFLNDHKNNDQIYFLKTHSGLQ